MLIIYRSIFADDDDDDDNVADTLGIASKPVVNGEPVKKQAEKQSTTDEVHVFIPLIVILIGVLVAFLAKLIV